VVEGGQQPPDVVLDQAEQLVRPRRELADPQLVVEEDRGHVDAFEQVADVAIELGQLRNLHLVFGVDRVQLLVDAVQLLVDGLQLLVRRLQTPRW
jgi:hypothetical protein